MTILNGIFGFLCIVLVGGVSVWLGIKLQHIQTRSCIHRWAADKDYRLLSWKFLAWRSFFNDRWVFRVVVLTPDSQKRNGLVRIGGLLLGPLSNESHAAWDDVAADKN